MIDALNNETTSQHGREVASRQRFEFGKNWSRFLAVLDDTRIANAEESLSRMLDCEHLSGKRFLDVGSGSGLFSLAARRLGAEVHSFDYDPSSVACTKELRRRYFPGDDRWVVEEGSALDESYLASLKSFDVVYSWGVLHHTGQMWRAMENVCPLVAPGGRLYIALYNDMGSQSSRWRYIKRTYNKLPRALRLPLTLAVIAPGEAKSALRSLLTLQPGRYVKSWTLYNQRRGMSRWHDIVDWVGGYPYEVAKPEEVFNFCRARGFTLTKLRCGGVGLGCNEFVFAKND